MSNIDFIDKLLSLPEEEQEKIFKVYSYVREIRNQVDKLNKDLQDVESVKKNLQEYCSHPTKQKVACEPFGETCYEEFYCPACEKTWRVPLV